MDEKKVEQILKLSHYGITKLKGVTDDYRSTGWGIVGFDSEYNAASDTTISYQLYASEERKILIPGPDRITARDIARHAKNLLFESARRVLIVSYFNTAELSQLSTGFWTDSGLEVYPAHPSGILHIQGKEKITAIGRDQEYEFFFFDLWHWFASMKNNSLYAVAEMLGYEKRDWHRINEDHTRSISTLRLSDLADDSFKDYALHDARLCVEIFDTLDKTYRAINRVSIITRPTPANASQASFRRNYLDGNIRTPKHHIRKLALQANWGGRAECGYIGTHRDIFEHDADSLYPRSTLLLPNLPGPGQWKNYIPDSFEDIEGFIDLDFAFEDKEEVWPNLPVFKEGSLIFPLRGRTRCTIGELRIALQRSGFSIKKIWNIAWYKDGAHGEFHEFLRDQLDLKRENDSNAAIRAVAKLNMNSAIGKFIQWKGGYDFNKVSEYVRESKIEDPELIRLIYDGKILPEKEWLERHGISGGEQWYREPIRLGASFYPEWHTLILGKAREVIGSAIYDSEVYPRILTVATDAIYVPHDRVSIRYSIPFKRERGPMVFKPFRTRRHLSVDGEGHVLATAHHGMPMRANEAAFMMAVSNHEEKIVVHANGFNTAREAISKDTRFGSQKSRTITVSFLPDNKRRQTDSGWTMPWDTIAQMQAGRL